MQLPDVLDSLGLGSWVWNRKKNTLTFSEGRNRVHAVSGGSLQPLHYRLFLDLVYDEDRETLLREIFRLVSERLEWVEIHYRFPCVDGTLRWFSDRVKIQRIDRRGRVQALLGVTLDASRTQRHDTTLRKAIEERERMVRTLKQREASLKRLSDFSRSVLSNMSEGVLVLAESTGRIEFLNDAAASLFDLDRSDASGVVWRNVVPEGAIESVSQLLATLETENAAECEIAVSGLRDQYRWVLLRGRRLSDGQSADRYVLVASDVSSRKEREQHLRDMSHVDEVTGLPNRRFVTERLTEAMSRRARRPDDPLAVLFIDLDGFKAVNDHYGHVAGDMLLREIGGRISADLRSSDIVSRYGGDEFVVILESMNAEGDVDRVVTRLAERIRRPFIVNAKPVRADASIGVALFGSRDETPEHLINRADAAMYAEKNSVRGRDHMND